MDSEGRSGQIVDLAALFLASSFASAAVGHRTRGVSQLEPGGSLSLAFFYNQPIAHRFGIALQDLLADKRWESLDAAVAWVRRSGMNHIQAALQSFLARGGTSRFILGVDIDNTSYEGLSDLLTLTSAGQLDVFVYHNESAPTFHPKVYLFEGSGKAHLVVGSNNLTQAGLFTNTEGGLQIETKSDDSVIQQVREALDSWSDLSSGIVRQLDAKFLGELLKEGYVLPEKELQQRRAAATKAAKGTSGTKKKLFGSIVVTAPVPSSSASGAPAPASPVPSGAAVSTPSAGYVQGTVLLMRVRRASETERRTQIQIPISLASTPLFTGITELQSTHDGRLHSIRPARARGVVNTLKIDIPEIDPMSDPVLRLEQTASGLVYRAHDAGSPQGVQIMTALRAGLNQPPPHNTVLTLPSNPARSTWYRFI